MHATAAAAATAAAGETLAETMPFTSENQASGARS